MDNGKKCSVFDGQWSMFNEKPRPPLAAVNVVEMRKRREWSVGRNGQLAEMDDGQFAYRDGTLAMQPSPLKTVDVRPRIFNLEPGTWNLNLNLEPEPEPGTWNSNLKTLNFEL